jgi:hypothetical protein
MPFYSFADYLFEETRLTCGIIVQDVIGGTFISIDIKGPNR